MYTGDGESEEDKGDDNEESSFSFLHDRQGNRGHDSDSEKSSNDEPTSSGFSFLNTAPKETQDDQQRETGEDGQPTPGEGEEKMEQNNASTDSKHDAEVSMASSDKSSELPSLPQPTVIKGEESSITGRSPLKVGGGRAAGRQLPPPSGAVKKKKRKAVIPGKERMATSSGASNQAEPESPSSSKSDLSSRTTDDMVLPHDEVSEHSEQLIDIAASSEHGGEELVEGCLTEEVTIKPAQDTTTIPEENVNVAMATEDVDTADTSICQEPPTPEPVAMETADEEAESRTLEEVFGNYCVELSGEESYTALIESYQSSIKKIR